MKFIIADDHPLFREALSGALTPLFEGLEVLEAESTVALIELLARSKDVDLLLLDLSMPGANWFETLTTVKERYPALPIVMVSANDDIDVISQAITLGAKGYITKATPTKTIAEAIDIVLSGEQWLPADIAEKMTFNSGNMNDMLERFKELTPKQVLVLKYVRAGMMNKQIAHEMNVTEATVKAHISAALKKLDINTRTQAVLLMDKLQINGSTVIDPRLPLVDIHRHLDGNIRPETIWDLATRHNISLPAKDLDEFRPLCQIQDKTADLLAFLARLDYGISVLANTDACYRIAYENMQDAKRAGLDYVELRFSPFYMAQSHQLNVADVVEATIAGCADGSRDFTIKHNLIGILSRTFGTDACTRELNGLLAHKDHITALDLAGDELGYPAPLFTEHFKQARDAGWQITVHAGEADGPQSIWNAIELLGASRIGHCVAAKDDVKLLEYLVEHNIGVESCPTSNYQTATVVDIANHPMKAFLEAGVEVTLNTDDPGVSAIDIGDEYRVAKEVIRLSDEQLRQIQINGVNQSFISATEKQQLFEMALQR